MEVIFLLTLTAVDIARGAAPVDWIERSPSGAYQFAFATGDEGGHYRTELASADNTVMGRFGSRDPATGSIVETQYTAGRRGFRARGPNIARHMSLSQGGPARPHDDGQYHPELDLSDPNEDRGYDFQYRTRNIVKQEEANARGDVRGRYSYFDDVGGRHTVDYTAGARRGFNVHNPVPDTFLQAESSPLFFQGKGPGSKARGYTAIQKNLDGSYRFSASGPDHKRNEISDVRGNRRGSYTYLDDKGVQRTVEYIAGPNIGFQVINNRRPLAFGNTLFPLLSTPAPSLSDLLPTLGPTLPPLFSTADPFDPSKPFDLEDSSKPFNYGDTTKPFGSTNPSKPFGSGDPFGTSDPSSPSSSNNPSKPTKPFGSGDSTPPYGSTDSKPFGSGELFKPFGQTDPSKPFGSSTPTTSSIFSTSSSSTSTPPISSQFPGSSSTFPSSSVTPPLFKPNEWGRPTPSPTLSPWFDEPGSGSGSEDSSSDKQKETRNNCCRSSWRNSPKRLESDRILRSFEDEFTQPHKIAVRAHIQNVDVSTTKRYMSPGDALDFFSRKSPR